MVRLSVTKCESNLCTYSEWVEGCKINKDGAVWIYNTDRNVSLIQFSTFEVLTAVLIKVQVFCDVMSCLLVNRYRRLEGE